MKKIIYSTDFSSQARNALKFAHKISQRSGAQLVLLHVFDIPSIWNSPAETPTFPEMARTAKEMHIDKLRNLFLAESGNEEDLKKVEFIAKESPLTTKGILEVIDELEVDLLVMGAKGRSRMNEMFMGSTTMNLFKNSPCPVLCVPEKADYEGFSNIVYASAFAEDDLAAIKQLCPFADIFSAEVTIEHIAGVDESDAEDKLEKLKKQIADSGLGDQCKFGMIISDKTFHSLNDYLVSNKVSLLAMYERRHHGIDRLFHRDMVKRMEYHLEIPILCYNETSVAMVIHMDESDTTQIG